jgi:hypothetical protein
MSDPVCRVCGQECPPKSLRGKKLNACVNRTQEEILNPATVRALEGGKRVTL